MDIFEFETDSKWIKRYHTVLMVCCVLTFIGSVIMAFRINSYSSYYSGFSIYWAGFFIYLIVGTVISAIELVVCKVTCEFFNNINIIANKTKTISAKLNTIE